MDTTNRSIQKEQYIKAPMQRVFQALTTKADLEHWFVQKADIDLRPGGAIRLEWAPNAFEAGKIVAVAAPSHFSYTWEALSPSPTTVTFELTTQDGGTLLQLTHAGIGEGDVWDNYYNSINSGWDTHLNHLTHWLETGSTEAPAATGDIKNQ